MSALHLAILTAANRLPRARGAITSLCQELRAEPAIIERVRAAVTEACGICIQHADGDSANSDRFVLEASTAGGELIIRVSDRGSGIDDAEQGQLSYQLGLELIDELADVHEITRNDEGETCIEMRFALV